MPTPRSDAALRMMICATLHYVARRQIDDARCCRYTLLLMRDTRYASATCADDTRERAIRQSLRDEMS